MDAIYFKCAYVIFLFPLIVLVNSGSYQDTEALYNNIVSGKKADIRPVLDQFKPVIVSVYFHLVYIQEFNEVSGKLSVTGIFTIEGNDQTVSWNATDNHIYSLIYKGEDFWKPTFVIGNAFDDVKLIYKDDSVKRLFYNGDMIWSPADKFEVVCQADVSKYPFDTHVCSIWLYPFGYSMDELVVNPKFDFIFTDFYTKHKTWELDGTYVYRLDKPHILHINLKLKRQPMFFVLTFILPIGVMSILNILVFLLPPKSGERIGYGITVLLAIVVFLTICSKHLPATSHPRISSISLLLFTDVFLSALIVMFVIVGLRFYHQDENIPVSTLGKAFVRLMRRVRCKRRQKTLQNNIDSESKLKMGDGSNDRGTSGNYLSSITNSLDCNDHISWIDVGKEADFVFGCFTSICMLTVHVLYILDVTVGLPIFD